ncbi:hypothetical protein TDB9533_03329 [Thalassocella blandensis]|nr:hypothetical protein TDB9533_03329 [Thalassocella blandensis]
MSHIPLVDTTNVSSNQEILFQQIKGAFGVVPNMFKAIGNSSAALESMWTSFSALGNGSLNPKLGEKIAVLVADINRCEYCLAAHTVLGQKAGASLEEMTAAQSGKSSDPKVLAALNFAAKLVRERANVSHSDVQAVRDVGFSDEEIAEILAHVALNIFTNYTNVAFDVPIDFPKVNLQSPK